MDGPVDLDEQVRRTRARLEASPSDAAVGDLVTLLHVRGLLALRDDRDDDASADYREAAGLLGRYDGADGPLGVGVLGQPRPARGAARRSSRGRASGGGVA
jgi:hypothetical protein